MIRIIGLDYGERRIGVAVSDPLGMTAQAVGTISDISGLDAILKNYPETTEIVVGLPRMMNGQLGIQAQKTLGFVAELKKKFDLKISTWDERLTSVEAEKALIFAGLSRAKRKKVIDQSAAAIILQSYLDNQRK